MKVTKSTEKYYSILASNDDEAFDNLAKYIEDKNVYDLTEDDSLVYEIIDDKDEAFLDDEEEIDEDFYESEDCKTCKHYCPLCDECVYGDD